MTVYKTKTGRTIYAARQDKEGRMIHYVPDSSWTKYLEVRKETPFFCNLYDTLKEVKQALLRLKYVL